jgi:hypothetical protein
MTDEKAPHKADIGNNLALVTLYGLAIGALIVGVMIVGFASAQVNESYDPSGALAWQAIGAALLNAGFLLVTGALVAHAVNWQIGRSAK